MDDLLLKLIKKSRKRIRIILFVRSLLYNILFASILLSSIIISTRLFFPILNVNIFLYCFIFISFFSAILKAIWINIFDKDITLQLDLREGLRERISSALFISKDSLFAKVVKQDALKHANKIRISKIFPFNIQKIMLKCLLMIIICLFTYQYFPKKDLLDLGKKYQEKQHIANEKKLIAEKILKKIKTLSSKKKIKNLNFNLLIKDIEKIAKQLKYNVNKNKKEDIAKLSQLLDNLKKLHNDTIKQVKQNKPTLGENFEFKKTNSENLADFLNQKKFKQAAKQLNKIAKQLKNILRKKRLNKKLSKKEKQNLDRLQKNLSKLAKALKENNKLSKDLKKTLDKLSKQLSQLKKLDRLTAKENEQYANSLQQLMSIEEQLKYLQSLSKQLKMMKDMYQTLQNSRKRLANAGCCPICGTPRCPICGKNKCKHGKKCPGHKPSDFLSSGNGLDGNITIPNQRKGMGQGMGQGQGRGKGGGKSPYTDKKGEVGWKPFKIKGENFKGREILNINSGEKRQKVKQK